MTGWMALYNDADLIQDGLTTDEAIQEVNRRHTEGEADYDPSTYAMDTLTGKCYEGEENGGWQ